ncbi:MAG TPA: YHYH domain-containing protein, partial [Luteimonas sp.]|nr:YHYH domain-containing protein [Luteimonas sp.]
MDRSLSTCFAIAAALMPVADALAHSGGLDRHGCHHDRKRGGYHCHRAPVPAVSEARYAPRNNLTGYVIPQRGAFKNCRAARAAG